MQAPFLPNQSLSSTLPVCHQLGCSQAKPQLNPTTTQQQNSHGDPSECHHAGPLHDTLRDKLYLSEKDLASFGPWIHGPRGLLL